MLRRILISSMTFLAAAHFVIAETAAVTHSDTSVKRSAFGQVEPTDRPLPLAPPETRVVKTIFSSEGALVRKGEAVLEVECDIEQAEHDLSLARVALAKERLESAEANLKVSEDHLRSQAIAETRVDFDRRQLELKKKELEVALKQADLSAKKVERFTLRAPMDGRIYKLDVRTGEPLSRGDVTSVVCGSEKINARLFVEGGIEESFTKDGNIVLFNAASGEQVAEGRVVRVINGQVIVELDNSQQPPLPFGMTLRAEI